MSPGARSAPWIALAVALLPACTVATKVSGGPTAMDAAVDGRASDAGADVIPADAGPPCTDFATGLGTDQLIEILDGRLLGTDATLVDVEVEDPAQIVLARSTHRYGVVLVSGHEEPLLGETPAPADLVGATPRLRAFRDSLRGTGAAGTPPHGLTLADDGTYTVVIEGEVCLAAGVNNVAFDVDDRGFAEIPGLLELVRTSAGGMSMSFTASREGFYPIRIAYENDSGSGAVAFNLSSPEPPPGSCSIGELRVDARAIEGREAMVWPSRILDASPLGSRLDTDDSDQRFGDAAYPDSPLPTADNWALRLVGRHVLSGDLMSLNVSSNEGHRIWVDGVYLGGVYGGGRLSAVYELPMRGPRDFVVELEEGGGDAELTYTIGGVPFSAAATKPVTAFGGSPWGVGATPDADVHAGASRMELLTVLAPSTPASAVEISAIIDGVTDPDAVDLSVVTPTSMSTLTTLANAGRPTGTPLQWIFHRVLDFGTARPVAAGTYLLTLANRSDSTVRWMRAGVLAHLAGRTAAHPTTGTLTTSPRTYRDEIEVRRLVADAELPPGTSVALAIRAGSAAAQLESLPWVDARADGSLLVPQRGRVVQVRATLTGNGLTTPRLRDVRLVGHACRRCVPPSCPSERASDDLVALYTFEEGSGDRVLDRSGAGSPLDLRIWRTDRVSWSRSRSALTIVDDTMLAYDGPPARLYQTFVGAREISVEAWVAPESTSQAGPARIVVNEHDINGRNFALGQDAERYEGRLRRGGNDAVFFPSADGSARAVLQQIVLVRGADDRGRIYVDGELSGDPVDWAGGFSAWEPYFSLAVANSPANLDRPWHGEITLLAIYARELTSEEVLRHFALGGRLSSNE